jgi:membrane protease YdiL (CAAX protease family)
MKNTLRTFCQKHWASCVICALSATAFALVTPADRALSSLRSVRPAMTIVPSALSPQTLSLFNVLFWLSLLFLTLGIVFIRRFIVDPRRAIKRRVSSQRFPVTLDADTFIDTVAIVIAAATLLFCGRIAAVFAIPQQIVADLPALSLTATAGFQVFSIWAVFHALLGKTPLFRIKRRTLATLIPLFTMYLSIIPITLAASVIAVFASNALGVTAAPMPLVEAVLSGTLADKTLGLLAVTAVILAPLAEELIFRGLIFSFLRKHMSFAYAATTSAIIFAVLHEHSLSILPITVLGIFFAYAYEKTKDLTACVVLHAIYNSLSLATLLVFRSALAG